MNEHKSRQEMLSDMINLAIEINGTERRTASVSDKPTVMIRFSGHTAALHIQIYPHGWEKEKSPEICYDMYFDTLFSQEEYNHVYAELRLLRDMVKDEK